MALLKEEHKTLVGEERETPVKRLKTDKENEQRIELVLHAKRYSISLNKDKCMGCGVCVEICPREAVELVKTGKTEGEKAERPSVTFSEEKCDYCGMCDAICPFGALTLMINGEHVVPVVKTESFPELIREIEVDNSKCGPECLDVQEPCPLGLIKVTVQTMDGKEITDSPSLKNRKDLKVSIEVDVNSCPCCGFCETKFPEGAVKVEKIFEGSIKVDVKKCPEGCRDCVDVCPITGVLYLSDEGKVQVNDRNCIYCGVCRNVCPVEDAIELVRTRVRHSQVRSGAWNKALEKIASTKAVVKELKTKSGRKLKEAVKNRLAVEAESRV